MFGHRLDLCETGFIPKRHIWRNAPQAWKNLVTQNGLEKPDLVVLGDELYDSYLFAGFKELVPSVFNSVEACAVGGPLPGADRLFANEAEALSYVEKILVWEI